MKKIFNIKEIDVNKNAKLIMQGLIVILFLYVFIFRLINSYLTTDSQDDKYISSSTESVSLKEDKQQINNIQKNDNMVAEKDENKPYYHKEQKDELLRVGDGLFIKNDSLISLKDNKKSKLLFVVYPSWGAFGGIAGSVYVVDASEKRVTEDKSIMYKDRDWLDKFVNNSPALFFVDLDLSNLDKGKYYIVIKKSSQSGLEQNDTTHKIPAYLK